MENNSKSFMELPRARICRNMLLELSTCIVAQNSHIKLSCLILWQWYPNKEACIFLLKQSIWRQNGSNSVQRSNRKYNIGYHGWHTLCLYLCWSKKIKRFARSHNVHTMYATIQQYLWWHWQHLIYRTVPSQEVFQFWILL